MPESSAGNPPGSVRREGERPAILIVDDNRANRLAMEGLLATLDLDVAAASSGEEALKELLQREFAVVLMDVQMPGLDGFQTTELIRQRDRTKSTPIIFVTAIFTDVDSAKKAYALGALDYVTKPFDQETLRAKVASLVDRYRQSALVQKQAEALRRKEKEIDRAVAGRQAAEESNRAKDEFLAMLSHELRSPLNAILGWSSVLEHEPDLSPRLTTAAQAIARGARLQSKLINDLLDLSLMTANQLTLAERVVDLAMVAQSVLASMQPVAVPRRVQLNFSVAAGDHRTIGDAARLEQLLTNLVANAIKFSHDGDPVNVELVRLGDLLRLQVKDAGIGIAPELLPHVFDRFRQADGSRTRRFGGLGIGLTLARQIAELHRGRLEAFSAGEGSGASFMLTLPARDAEVAAYEGRSEREPSRGAEAAETRPLAGKTLLLVDDDPDVRVLLQLVLSEAGADVVEASSSAEALAAFRARPADILISDLGMPDESGLGLMRKIRALESGRRAPLVAVALTGYGSADDRAQSIDAGFQAHVVKPCEPADLIALLARLTKHG